jgi:uncharacterized protein YbbC (DUF1343 family)
MRAHYVFLVKGLALVALAACGQPAPAQVRPGITVLLADSAHLIKGKRLGLLTNQTGVDAAGRRDVDLLTAGGYRLTALFSPEHGFRGAEDRPGLADTRDSASGLPIYSLYGGTRAARERALDSIDVLLVDLQDVGARYYTYPASATQLLREAARRKRRLIVLDRPDPIGGVVVQGNVRAAVGDPDSAFVGFLPVPMRHGMTLGELLRMADDLLGLHADLVVVPATGWHRAVYYDATGLPWIKPSPNMPDLESATHYPGTCLFEGTNLSVGRGTPYAFQVVGASWLDPAAVLRRLRARPADFAGATVDSIAFAPLHPTDGKYDGVTLRGVRLAVTDRGAYDPVRTGVALLAAIRAAHPDSFQFRDESFDRLAAGSALRRALLAGRSATSIAGEWASALAQFKRVRAKYLVY